MDNCFVTKTATLGKRQINQPILLAFADHA